MSERYVAEVEIVLAGYEDLHDAEHELEEVMSGIGFTKSVLYYRGSTDLLPTDLENHIRTFLLGKLTYSDDLTVHVVNQGQQIIR